VPDRRLAVLKALGDNTRYAIYLELARAPAPLSTADVAESLDLHPNTVRPHLERMREVGLLSVTMESRGAVGRPQHRYALAPDAPSLGLEPPAMPQLARMLLTVASAAGAGSDDCAEAGREHGRAVAAAMAGAFHDDRDDEDGDRATTCVAALLTELDRLGFDPEVAGDDDGTTVAFTHCPFAALAEAHPELVCHLHRGIVEGVVAGMGGATVARFGTLVDRRPCSVDLVEDPAEPVPSRS
jgi:predicted ArsR family transcriptional regulator